MVHNPRLRCSFCGRAKDDDNVFIAGPGIYICDACIQLSVQIIKESDALSDAGWLSELTIFSGEDLRRIQHAMVVDVPELLRQLTESKPDSLLALVLRMNDLLKESLLKIAGPQYAELTEREKQLEADLEFRRRRLAEEEKALGETDKELSEVAQERAAILEQFPKLEQIFELPVPPK